MTGPAAPPEHDGRILTRELADERAAQRVDPTTLVPVEGGEPFPADEPRPRRADPSDPF